MKLACASSSFARDLERGELTQLEFLDLCARELACDGVVLDVRHFPRTDDDYLAQVKKMATDRGLSIAALADATFFTAETARRDEVLRCATAVGAPIVAGPLARETESSWSEQLARLGAATARAKTTNITLAVRNAPQTFAGTTHDLRRVVKEADSAWLRYGPEPAALDAASDPSALVSNTVLLWSDARTQTQALMAATIKTFDGFRGHLAIDDTSGTANAETIAVVVRTWRASTCLHEAQS